MICLAASANEALLRHLANPSALETALHAAGRA